MTDFESLLNEKKYVTDDKKIVKSIREREVPPLKANKNATLYDFITMISKIVKVTMRDLNVKFIPDEKKGLYLGTDQPMDQPIITYYLVDRVPKEEIKPRVREDIKEVDSDGNLNMGTIYGQKFKCHLQFNIFASVYGDAEQVMERFEEVMFKYAGYFKKNGVAELYFEKQFTDEFYDQARQSLSVRNMRYYVEIEKITVIFKQDIKNIESC